MDVNDIHAIGVDIECTYQHKLVYEIGVVSYCLGSNAHIMSTCKYLCTDVYARAVRDELTQKLAMSPVNADFEGTLKECLEDIERFALKRSKTPVIIMHSLDNDMKHLARTFELMYGQKYFCPSIHFLPRVQNRVCSQMLIQEYCHNFRMIRRELQCSLDECLQRIGRNPGSLSHTSVQDCIDLYDVLQFAWQLDRYKIPIGLKCLDPLESHRQSRLVTAGLV